MRYQDERLVNSLVRYRCAISLENGLGAIVFALVMQGSVNQCSKDIKDQSWKTSIFSLFFLGMDCQKMR